MSENQSRTKTRNTNTKKTFKVMIPVIVSVVVAAIVGWQVHVIIAQKNENQLQSPTLPTQPSTTLPTRFPTSITTLSPTVIPAETLQYIEEFLDSSLTNQTLHERLPEWKDTILRIETDIKQFMQQKLAIKQLFRNVSCAQVTYQGGDFNHWYSFVSNSKPTIHLINITHNITWPHANIDDFNSTGICESENGWVTEIDLEDAMCSGTVDLASLPNLLKVLILKNNQFTGAVNLTSLPQSLTHLDLNQNQFIGTVDLTLLPVQTKLVQLDLSDNQFTGTINLRSLPASLQHLFLNKNKFTGTVDLTLLPPSLQLLKVNQNQFTGSVNLISLPQSLGTLDIDLGFNNFTGIVDLSYLTNFTHQFDLCVSGNQIDDYIGGTPEMKEQIRQSGYLTIMGIEM